MRVARALPYLAAVLFGLAVERLLPFHPYCYR